MPILPEQLPEPFPAAFLRGVHLHRRWNQTHCRSSSVHRPQQPELPLQELQLRVLLQAHRCPELHRLYLRLPESDSETIRPSSSCRHRQTFQTDRPLQQPVHRSQRRHRLVPIRPGQLPEPRPAAFLRGVRLHRRWSQTHCRLSSVRQNRLRPELQQESS